MNRLLAPRPSLDSRSPSRRPRAGLVAVALAGMLLAMPPADAAPRPAPIGRLDADRLASEPPGSARNALLVQWSRDASLDDLLWVLRRDPAELAGIEAVFVDAALRRVSPARRELGRRLEARRLLLDPRAARKAGREDAELEALRPRQSVFRVGVLLPDRGDYAGYAASVRSGLATGLAWKRPAGALPIAIDDRGTGEGEIARGAEALDTLSRSCGAIVGELLSVSTSALATGARMLGLPLVSPTATDENIGRIGPAVFQVGPSSAQRGRRLAAAVLVAGPRKVAILTSSAVARSTFVQAFAVAAESLGATIVRRDSYAPGTTDFRIASRSMRTFGVDLLLWDGESREADALLRQLAADGIAVRLCGGVTLAPDRFHAPTRALLEGVVFVADDWELAEPERAMLDSLARTGGEKSAPLWVRGFLAGRRLAAGVDAGARTPVELAARLRHRHAEMREAGFLDCTLDGALLPVYTVRRGKAVEFEGP